MVGYGIKIHNGKADRLKDINGKLKYVVMSNNEKVTAKSMFFSTGYIQHSKLTSHLSCECKQHGAINYNATQETNVPGLYVADDTAKNMQLIILGYGKRHKVLCSN